MEAKRIFVVWPSLPLSSPSRALVTCDVTHRHVGSLGPATMSRSGSVCMVAGAVCNPVNKCRQQPPSTANNARYRVRNVRCADLSLSLERTFVDSTDDKIQSGHKSVSRIRLKESVHATGPATYVDPGN